MKEWAIKNAVPIVCVVLALLGLYWAIGKVDSMLETRNSELRGQIKADIGEAQTAIKTAVADAEKHLKEAKEAEGTANTNAANGKGKADAAAKKKLADMVNDWNTGATP